MIIGGEKYKVQQVFKDFMTIPDSWVLGKNKVGTGHGEAKFYISSKEEMRNFYGPAGFNVRVIMLKSDILSNMHALENEYKKPSQDYIGKDNFSSLYQERLKDVEKLPDVITFLITDQQQIDGPRGYVNSDDNYYKLIRNIALPWISYISAMQLVDSNNCTIFYWKIYVDFDRLEKTPLALTYGKKLEDVPPIITETPIKYVNKTSSFRIGQDKYRQLLLEECPICPFTRISDERLLIASHIKPWVASSDKEKIDPKNGFIFSPLFDKLFDKGFITFTEDKRLVISDWLSPYTIKQIGIYQNQKIDHLPLDDERMKYLTFHQSSVFHGSIEM